MVRRWRGFVKYRETRMKTDKALKNYMMSLRVKCIVLDNYFVNVMHEPRGLLIFDAPGSKSLRAVGLKFLTWPQVNPEQRKLFLVNFRERMNQKMFLVFATLENLRAKCKPVFDVSITRRQLEGQGISLP